MEHNFAYKWYLKDGYPEKNGLKVFSTFACGGGSSMGYKLAGYEVIGANDIDPQTAKVYKANHNPKYFFECPIKDLITKELPEELFNLDILDGSPPCSTFSMAGSREKAWGKNKMFREGQAKQVLDDLFFDFIDLVERLKPKVVVAENVKGMLAGNAKGYLIEIKKRLQELGYEVQIFCLNGATMGLPQRRERVFIICNRMGYPKLKLEFNEKPIYFKNINEGVIKDYKDIEPASWKYYDKCEDGNSISTVHPKGSFFSRIKLSNRMVANTLTAKSGVDLYNPNQRRVLTKKELSLIGSYPLDYDFLNLKPGYLIGMSVPPVMMAQVSNQIKLQWFNKK
jgi:DNA (cytosine-5)-methyltransferase 1